MAFLEFADFLWETTKPTVVLKDNKSFRQFLQTKAVPPTLWNACDCELQFDFKVAHITGSVNTADEFISRRELNDTEKIRFKIREEIQATPLEVTTSSSDITDEEQFFFTQADNEDESEEQTFHQNKHSRQDANQWVAN